jgi:hypothetical protein
METDTESRGNMNLNNVRFVPVQVRFKARDGFDSWRVQDVEQCHGEPDLTDDEGLVLCFYTLKRAQAYADKELVRQVEYEQEQERLRHVDTTMLGREYA